MNTLGLTNIYILPPDRGDVIPLWMRSESFLDTLENALSPKWSLHRPKSRESYVTIEIEDDFSAMQVLQLEADILKVVYREAGRQEILPVLKEVHAEALQGILTEIADMSPIVDLHNILATVEKVISSVLYEDVLCKECESKTLMYKDQGEIVCLSCGEFFFEEG